MRRLLLILALAASAGIGSVVTTAASTPSSETTLRASLLDCVLVQEAAKLGIPARNMPLTVRGCFFLTRP